ncbi:mitogen-activated protein kinase kinase kinase 20-like [Argentina anserina]|uniref:mitogen-activated protein kinase kinase kinase 20-like n=1 Tax=Argentina anserina TaxID=57926 RepID=UPI00217679CA|nr:mitogen-activated protein kinase kinase kinase 20-like [Potentilla anserina]
MAIVREKVKRRVMAAKKTKAKVMGSGNNWIRGMGTKKSKAAELSLGSGLRWVRGDKIGEGGFGSVFVAFSNEIDVKLLHMPVSMAIKSAKVKDSDPIKYEFEVFKEMDGESCRFIIEHYGEEVTSSNRGEQVYNLAMEIAWGSLARLLEVRGFRGLEECHVRSFTGDILKGVRHIHNAGFVHCDLKPDNILLVKYVYDDDEDRPVTFTAKVGDLGLVKKEEVGERWKGTPPYLSPETVSDNKQKKPSDIWAVGLIVLELLTGERPRSHFYDDESDTLYVLDGFEPKIPDTISSLAGEFIGFCLQEVPEHRWTVEELLTHPFVADFRESESD